MLCLCSCLFNKQDSVTRKQRRAGFHLPVAHPPQPFMLPHKTTLLAPSNTSVPTQNIPLTCLKQSKLRAERKQLCVEAASPGSDLQASVLTLSSSLRSPKIQALALSCPAPLLKGLPVWACQGADVNGEEEPPSPPALTGVTAGHRAIYIYNSPTAPDQPGANQQLPSLSDSVCANQEVLSL